MTLQQFHNTMTLHPASCNYVDSFCSLYSTATTAQQCRINPGAAQVPACRVGADIPPCVYPKQADRDLDIPGTDVETSKLSRRTAAKKKKSKMNTRLKPPELQKSRSSRPFSESAGATSIVAASSVASGSLGFNVLFVGSRVSHSRVSGRKYIVRIHTGPLASLVSNPLYEGYLALLLLGSYAQVFTTREAPHFTGKSGTSARIWGDLGTDLRPSAQARTWLRFDFRLDGAGEPGVLGPRG